MGDARATDGTEGKSGTVWPLTRFTNTTAPSPISATGAVPSPPGRSGEGVHDMRMLLGTTALAVAIAASAFAQTATRAPDARQTRVVAETGAAEMAFLSRGALGDIHASEMIGATLYSADRNATTIESRDDWDDVGVVNDLLMSRDGAVRAILVDVGTFLGMGGKTIAVPPGALHYVTDGQNIDDYVIVITTDRETLQEAPAYERPTGRVTVSTMNNPVSTTHSPSPFAFDGYARADHNALTVSQLEKARVYGRGDEEIGSISSMVVTPEGTITDAVVDVGGFLGMGAHSVAIPFADLTVLRETAGDSVRVYIDATKDQLKAMPRHGS